MYARSTTVQARPEAIDAGTAHIRDEVMPALREIEGFIGLSLLVDRQSGRCIATTAWESEDVMRANAERVRPIRERAIAMFGGPATMDEWEIAVLHRDHRIHDGACARATWGQVDPANADAAIEYYKTTILPEVEKLDGFCSASLMVNRSTGVGVGCATFDSLEAMNRNRAQATALRDARLKEGGVTQLDECEFEVAFAHLRVPELV